MNLAASVTKRYGANFNLNVTVSLAPGITMLFGASGSGKTTLLRSISGLTTPDAGSIAIGQHVLFSRTPRVDVPVEQRNIGYVFQQLALFPHLTIGDNIAFGLHGVERSARADRVRAIAESFRIPHVLTRPPAEASGGERQRAALARSLVLNPSVLLLDEPLSALDHATQTLIIDDLRAWNATHRIPIVYVTHAHSEVFALGERVLAMDRGQIVADGTPTEVLETPTREPIAHLAGFENFFSASVIARKSDGGTMVCRLPRSGTELEVPLMQTASDGSVRVAIRAGDILMATAQPQGLSARNIIPGRIVSLIQRGTTVVAVVDAGRDIEVHLTPGARTALHLVEGAAIWLVIKTHSCHIVSD
jgi:molybdate transport system ATP-binding protein